MEPLVFERLPSRWIKAFSLPKRQGKSAGKITFCARRATACSVSQNRARFRTMSHRLSWTSPLASTSNAVAAKLKAIKVELQRRKHVAPVRSVYGSARSYPATTNTMLFPATSTRCTSSGIASIGSGGAFWFAAAKPRGRSGRSLFRSSKGGYQKSNVWSCR